MLLERADAALDEGLLARTKQHGLNRLLCPGRTVRIGRLRCRRLGGLLRGARCGGRPLCRALRRGCGRGLGLCRVGGVRGPRAR